MRPRKGQNRRCFFVLMLIQREEISSLLIENSIKSKMKSLSLISVRLIFQFQKVQMLPSCKCHFQLSRQHLDCYCHSSLTINSYIISLKFCVTKQNLTVQLICQVLHMKNSFPWSTNHNQAFPHNHAQIPRFPQLYLSKCSESYSFTRSFISKNSNNSLLSKISMNT